MPEINNDVNEHIHETAFNRNRGDRPKKQNKYLTLNKILT